MAFERVGVEAVVKGLSKFKSSMRDVNAAIELAGEQAKKTQKETESLNKAMVGLGAGLLAASAASAALLGSSIKLAARVETLGVVVEQLGRNVNLTKTEVDEFVEGIRKQGITLRQSRSAFARMVQAQIDFTKGSELARLAQDAAVIANINSSDAFERLIFVITSGNVRMARNLGLQVSFQGAYEKSASAIGKTTLELTELEKIQARTNVVLEAGTNIAGAYEAAMETAGKKVLSLDRQLEESRRLLGEAWLPVFAAAVDIVTDLLKAWQNLSEGTRDSISIFAGVATVIGGVVGAFLVLAPTVSTASTAFTALAATIGVTTLALAAWALAIGVVVIAGIQLLAFIKDTKRGTEETNKVIEDHARTILETSESYEEYATEVRRVNDLIDEQGILGALLVDKLVDVGEETFNVARAAREADVRMIAAGEAFILARDGAEDLRTEEEKLADAEAEAAKQAEIQAKNTAFLEQKMKDLSTVIKGDLGKNAEKTGETIADLETDLEDLAEAQKKALAEADVGGAEDLAKAQERLAQLNQDEKILLASISEAKARAEERDVERSRSTILREAKRLQALRENQAEQVAIIEGASQAQINAVTEIEAEFAEKEQGIRDEIAETQKAFSEQTAQFIFDMTSQKLALDGLTREEISFLEQLAGPDGLGIIDEPTLALLGRLDEIEEGLAKPGNQIPGAIRNLEELFGVFNDGVFDADALTDAINRVPFEKLTEVRRFQQGAAGVGLGFTGRQLGGPVSRGRPQRVGERGPELFLPGGSGNIISNRAIQNLGAVMAAAAPVAAPGGGGGGGSSRTEEFNLTIQTAAPIEPIQADFEMMRALSDRQRGGL